MTAAPPGPAPDAHPGRRRRGRLLAELAMGARMALAGGAEGRVRVTLTALGIGLAVALLLLAASVPAAWEARSERLERVQLLWGQPVARSDGTLLVQAADHMFREQRIRGLHLRPEGPAAPAPPGTGALPAPGEMVVSPALQRLLDSPDGELLRPRLDHRIVGQIGDDGLRSPHELAYYLGDPALTEDTAARIDRFGMPPEPDRPLPVALAVLLAVGLVVLLLPIVIFVVVAVRFGGERRDRRLAAVRLAGADTHAIRRIAAGEVLVAALLGLAVGAVLYLLGRQLAERVVLLDISLFAADLRPAPWLALLVLLGVPGAAVAATVLAMRGLVVEPLGVVRRGQPVRRRLWWRLVAPAAGLALLLPLLRRDLGTASGDPYQVAAGVGLLLLGVATLLPWLIDVLVSRQRGAGSLSWQLAMRRLQVSGGTTGRIVNGTAVAAAGAIALQMLLFGAQEQFTTGEPVELDPHAARVNLREDTTFHADPAEAVATFRASTGVRAVQQVTVAAGEATADNGDEFHLQVAIGGCAALAQLAHLPGCADGDVFLAQPDQATLEQEQYLPAELRHRVRPGDRVRLGGQDDGPQWRVPATAPTAAPVEGGFGSPPQVLATPGAGVPPPPVAHQQLHLTLDPAEPDAIEHARNTAYGLDPWLRVSRPQQPVAEDDQLTLIRRGLLLGVVLTLAMIGLSLLVGTVEQLRERRRLLAALTAIGAGRGTLAWSVLWQTAFPVLLGMLVAAAVGVVAGMLLLSLTDLAVAVEPGQVAAVAGIGGATVLAVTVLAMPVLWRLMRPDGLRTE